MKYILDNKSDAINSITENDIKGLEIKSSNSDNVLKAEKITIVDDELKGLYIKQKIDKKIIEIITKMRYLLENNDTSDGDIGMVLDEVQKLKGIIINKYKEHLSATEYKAFLQKILLTEEEFQRKYNARQIYKEMLMEDFNENMGKGR